MRELITHVSSLSEMSRLMSIVNTTAPERFDGLPTLQLTAFLSVYAERLDRIDKLRRRRHHFRRNRSDDRCRRSKLRAGRNAHFLPSAPRIVNWNLQWRRRGSNVKSFDVSIGECDTGIMRASPSGARWLEAF